MLVNLIREGLGRIIAAISVLTQGKPMARNQEQQAQVTAACKNLSLYQFYACPFCIKVRRQMHQLNLPIEFRDIKKNPEFRSELEENGGRVKVPCLRIEENGDVQWMYESNDIIDYLQQRFG